MPGFHKILQVEALPTSVFLLNRNHLKGLFLPSLGSSSLPYIRSVLCLLPLVVKSLEIASLKSCSVFGSTYTIKCGGVGKKTCPNKLLEKIQVDQ